MDFIDCSLAELYLFASALRLLRITDRHEPIAKALQLRLDTEIALRRGLRTSPMRQRDEPSPGHTPR